MSSRNKPNIQALISAVANGLNASQTSDLMQKIADDLDEVHSWIDTGPIPRPFTSDELGGNVAYTDKYNDFQLGFKISGIDPSGVINPGDFVFDKTTRGTVIKLSTGGTDDFEMLDAAGNPIIQVPTGTRAPQFSAGIKIAGAAINTPGAISQGANTGLQLTGIVGATYDFAILNPIASIGILLVPTGTSDMQYQGNFIQIVGKYHEFLERAAGDPAAGPANSGRLYCKDNGAGKTQLCIRFNTGAVQVISTEP